MMLHAAQITGRRSRFLAWVKIVLVVAVKVFRSRRNDSAERFVGYGQSELCAALAMEQKRPCAKSVSATSSWILARDAPPLPDVI